MGAWSENIFGNDTACDWLGDFLEEPGLPPLCATIEAVLAAEAYLDSDESCECLAACEVLARLQGRWGVRDAYTEALDNWIEANPQTVPEDIRVAADSAITRILGPASELPELWDERGRNDEWHAIVDDLRTRVSGR